MDRMSFVVGRSRVSARDLSAILMWMCALCVAAFVGLVVVSKAGAEDLRFARDAGGGWNEVALGEVEPVDLGGVNDALPDGAAILGWMPDGRLVIGDGDKTIFFIGVPSGEVQTMALEWWVKAHYSTPALDGPVFDVRADGARFLGTSAVPDDGDWENGVHRPRVVEYDANTGDVLRSWKTDEIGNGISKAMYIGDGSRIAVLAIGSNLPGMSPATVRKQYGQVLEWSTHYPVGAGWAVTVLEADGTSARVGVDALDIAAFRSGLAVMAPELSSSLKVFGHDLWQANPGIGLYTIAVSGQFGTPELQVRLPMHGVLLDVVGERTDNIYFTSDGGGTEWAGVARLNSVSGETTPVLRFGALPSWTSFEPYVAVVVAGRGIYLAQDGADGFRAWWASLDGTQRFTSLNAILPDGAHVKFSPDGEWMAVMDEDGVLRVYGLKF